MGNEARYWFKQKSSVLFTEEQRKKNSTFWDHFIKLGGLPATGYEGTGIEFTNDIKSSLKMLGFVTWDKSKPKDCYENIYETTEVNGKTYLYFIYAYATNS